MTSFTNFLGIAVRESRYSRVSSKMTDSRSLELNRVHSNREGIRARFSLERKTRSFLEVQFTENGTVVYLKLGFYSKRIVAKRALFLSSRARNNIFGSLSFACLVNGKRQSGIFFARFSFDLFVSYYLSCVKRIIMHCSFKTTRPFLIS